MHPEIYHLDCISTGQDIICLFGALVGMQNTYIFSHELLLLVKYILSRIWICSKIWHITLLTRYTLFLHRSLTGCTAIFRRSSPWGKLPAPTWKRRSSRWRTDPRKGLKVSEIKKLQQDIARLSKDMRNRMWTRSSMKSCSWRPAAGRRPGSAVPAPLQCLNRLTCGACNCFKLELLAAKAGVTLGCGHFLSNLWWSCWSVGCGVCSVVRFWGTEKMSRTVKWIWEKDGVSEWALYDQVAGPVS
jgi:hypothetical protein